MRPDHHGAGRINDAHSPRLHGVQHGVLDAVRRDHERLALQVLQRAGDTDSRFLQPGNHLRIVDQRTPGVHVAGCSLRGAARHLHRALHTAAEAHVFGHENFHRSLAYYGMDRIASFRRRIAWWHVARDCHHQSVLREGAGASRLAGDQRDPSRRRAVLRRGDDAFAAGGHGACRSGRWRRLRHRDLRRWRRHHALGGERADAQPDVPAPDPGDHPRGHRQ